MKFTGRYECHCCRPSPTCALIEFRALNQPGGKARAMEDYRAQLRHRAAVLNGELGRDKERDREAFEALVESGDERATEAQPGEVGA